MRKISAYIRLLRPHQWTKNLIIFVALVFSGRVFLIPDLVSSLLAFGLFCILSSTVYTLNDIADVNRDRRHPTKRNRPIAAGDVPVWAAWISFVLMSAVSLALSYYYLGLKFWIMAVFYFVLNFAYSFFLKRLVIIDVMVVAAGYVIRAVAGVFAIVAISTFEISLWLIICTFFLALLIAVGKRRGELTEVSGLTLDTRETLSKYSPQLLDQMVVITTASTIMSYSLYTIWPETIERLGTRRMAFTIPVALYGVLRYLYLIYRKGLGAAPARLLFTDLPLMLTVVAYAATVFIILYLMV